MKSLKLEDLTHNADLQKYLIFKEKLDSHKISNFTIEIRFLRKDKTIVWINKPFHFLKEQILHMPIYRYFEAKENRGRK
jgi:hypothetical protein